MKYELHDVSGRLQVNLETRGRRDVLLGASTVLQDYAVTRELVRGAFGEQSSIVCYRMR